MENIHENGTFQLHNKVEIPQVGFGTWQMPDGETAADAVMHAIEAGYTHIDTAAVYHNEIGVGAGIRMSGVPREKLFVTSKLWNDVRGYEETLKAFDASLKRLALDYLDLYLIHWPRPLAFRDTYQEVNRETWKAFEYLLEKGYVRAIGVSNFLPVHMEALLKTAQVIPMVDQIEFHPGWMQPETAAFCKEHDILVEAWSPLGSGKLLEDPKLKEFGQKYGWNVLIVLILTVGMFIYLKYCKQGYEIAVVGESENTAKYAGIHVKKVIIRTMAISGAICGIAGFVIVSGASHTISTATAGGRGFTAIIVAWLSKFNTFIMVAVSFGIVFMNQGAVQIATQYGLNENASDVILGIILFFLIGAEFFINYRVKRTKK